MPLTLTQKEFIIAGLLQEGPHYGYEIEQKIKNRGMRNWTDIGFSSIYHILKKLTKTGFTTQTSNIVNGKVQQIYKLTSDGKEAVKDQIRLIITDVKTRHDEFDTAISNSLNMDSTEIRSLLNKRIEKINEKIKEMENLRKEKLESGTPNIPAITILFDRPIKFLKAELELLNEYVNKF